MTIVRRPRRRLSAALYATAGGLVAVGIALFAIQPAAASDDGWGPDGATAATSSGVTVQWDGGGATPKADTVPRDATQVLPHTGGKTYADIPSSTNDAFSAIYHGASISVSQTTGLVHQAVNVTASGLPDGDGFTIMQCWGSSTESQPDPQHCEHGESYVDGPEDSRVTGSDEVTIYDPTHMAAGGDYKMGVDVGLQGHQDPGSGTAALRATVVSSSSGGLASGAAGSVVFSNASGAPVATVAVQNGQADTTVTGLSGQTTFVAHYVASADENFTGAGTSQPLALPDQSVAVFDPPPATSVGDNSSPNVTQYIPFQAIDGTYVVERRGYFGSTTTNELGVLRNGNHAFELQTGAESAALGCGARSDLPSTATCWLVAVPDHPSTSNAIGQIAISPLSPAVWAQRLQVKLGFADVGTSCGSGARTISIGSELLLDAMNSWIPAMCSAAGVDLGYIQNDDVSARQQYAQGNTSLVFTSAPIDDSGGGTSTLYAPAGISAVTISVLATKPARIGAVSFPIYTNQAITGIRLTPRLVAKLLTESYTNGIDRGAGSNVQKALPWSAKQPDNLLVDPEFLALNPQIVPIETPDLLGKDIILTLSGTDATATVWSWLVHDPDAKAFLDGCPDPAAGGDVINPFYSTRTYAECADQKTALEATASAHRSPLSSKNPTGTLLPSTYTDATPSYPLPGGITPQPEYYERPAVKNQDGSVKQPADSLANLNPRENTFAAVATDVLRGQEKSSNYWCSGAIDSNCNQAPPETWVNATPPSQGSGPMGLTDATAAARNQLPTALLCDDSGKHCVGADDTSLQKAANGFVPSTAESHVLQPATTPDYAGGAYPLTIPVYAEVNTQGLDRATAQSYAKVLQYVSGPGQQPGFAIGSLPPGMTPLLPAMVTQDKAAIATLLAITDPVTSTTTTNSSSNTGSPPLVRDQIPPADTGADAPSPSASATPFPMGATPASAVGLYQWGAAASLVGALVAGILAPILGRRRMVVP